MKNLYSLLFIACLFIASCDKSADSNNASSGSSGTGGSLARFTIIGNYLYIANNYTLDVFDVTQSSKPVSKSSVPLRWNAQTIFPYNNNLFIGTANGMYIYSLADPANPKELSEVAHFRSCDPVVANDTMAFVTLRGGTPCGPATDGLYIHDIKNVTNPVLLSVLEMATPSGLALNDSIVYVCQQNNGLSIVNVQNSKAPILRGKIENVYFEDAIVYEKLLICYVSTGINLYDITEAANPVFISTVAN